MRRVAHVLTGVALTAGIAVLGAPAALAQEKAVCDAYPQRCVVLPDTGVLGDQMTRGDATAGAGAGAGATVSGSGVPGSVGARTGVPSSLPFTGGDVVLISLVGAAAVVGGAALVVTGRRRSSTAI